MHILHHISTLGYSKMIMKITKSCQLLLPFMNDAYVFQCLTACMLRLVTDHNVIMRLYLYSASDSPWDANTTINS
jgi:hypothetical protein